MANSADPDQLASSEANWSGSTLFAKAGYIRVQQDKGYGYVTLIADLAFYSSCYQHNFFSFDRFLMKLVDKVDMDKVPRGAVNWREHGCLLSVCLFMHHTSLYMALDC